MGTIVKKYSGVPKKVKKPIWEIWHKMMIRFDKDVSVKFMNCGFQGLYGESIDLMRGDETDKYSIQLYDHVVKDIDLYYKNILEIGSGRGGGASYITRYYDPKSYIGVDLSSCAVDFCNRYYTEPILSFVKGNADYLSFSNESFDRIINIESARFYGNRDRFFQESWRVLRDSGYLLFADIMQPKKLEGVIRSMETNGFVIEKQTDISTSIIAALEQDSERRIALIEQKIPNFLKKTFAQYAGVEGTDRLKSFKEGKLQYWSFVLRKK